MSHQQFNQHHRIDPTLAAGNYHLDKIHRAVAQVHLAEQARADAALATTVSSIPSQLRCLISRLTPRRSQATALPSPQR